MIETNNTNPLFQTSTQKPDDQPERIKIGRPVGGKNAKTLVKVACLRILSEEMGDERKPTISEILHACDLLCLLSGAGTRHRAQVSRNIRSERKVKANTETLTVMTQMEERKTKATARDRLHSILNPDAE